MTNKTIYETSLTSPLGEITLASDGTNLLGLWLPGQNHHGATLFKNMIHLENADELSILQHTSEWLTAYFAGQKPDIENLPLRPIGSAFRQLIWRYLCEIPYGQTITYGELAYRAAKDLGKQAMSAQAVGGAVGHNPISIIIPCHRVIGANGNLTGYAGGLDKKIWLLEHEKTT